jgi:hypothetical protein
MDDQVNVQKRLRNRMLVDIFKARKNNNSYFINKLKKENYLRERRELTQRSHQKQKEACRHDCYQYQSKCGFLKKRKKEKKTI